MAVTTLTGRFQKLQQLGSGAMGAVWKAVDLETGAIVAIKAIHPGVADDPEYLRRFENEVNCLQSIRSPYVARVHGYGRSAGIPFFVMEYVEGTTLAELLQRRLQERRTFTWDEARRIGAGIAHALEATHAAGLTHRDVKPANVVLTPDGRVKLVDFGVARWNGAAAYTVGPVGTLDYMAPDPQATPRSDLYALGCVLYELLCGVPPFQGGTMAELLQAHATQQPQFDRLPSEARPLIRALLQKRAERRPAGAAAVIAMLEAQPTARPTASPFVVRPSRTPDATLVMTAQDREWRPTGARSRRFGITIPFLGRSLSRLN